MPKEGFAGVVPGKVAHTRVGPRLHRLLVPVASLGWTAPPCPAEVKVHRVAPGWSLRVSCPAQTARPLSSWLQSMGAHAVEHDGTPDRLVLRGAFARLPRQLEEALEACAVEHIALSTEGNAELMLRCGEDAAKGLLQRLETGPSGAAALAPKITARQAELLQYCVARGYYSIPRRAPLRRLARELGISTTSLSLALRRAEAKIILAYDAGLRASGAQAAAVPLTGADAAGPAPPPIPRSGRSRAP